LLVVVLIVLALVVAFLLVVAVVSVFALVCVGRLCLQFSVAKPTDSF
jgi:hypothetical protein